MCLFAFKNCLIDIAHSLETLRTLSIHTNIISICNENKKDKGYFLFCDRKYSSNEMKLVSMLAFLTCNILKLKMCELCNYLHLNMLFCKFRVHWVRNYSYLSQRCQKWITHGLILRRIPKYYSTLLMCQHWQT